MVKGLILGAVKIEIMGEVGFTCSLEYEGYNLGAVQD